MLPVVGLLLFMVPLIWPRAGDADAVPTSASYIYVFAIWCILIALGGVLAHKIGSISDPRESGATRGDDDQASSEQSQAGPD